MRRDEASPQTSSESLPETSATDSTSAEATTALMSGQPQLVQLPFPAAGVLPAVVPGSVRLLPQGAVLASASTTTTSSGASTSSIFPQPHQPVLPLMPQPPQFYLGPTTAGTVIHPSFNPLQQAPLYQRIQMQIAVQPPSKTVYQRILKPFPSVYLILPPLHTNLSGDPLSLLYEALSAKSHEEGVFVEASVVRNDNGDPLDRAIDGQATARLERSGWNSGVYTATFKKLKLLTTSQQRSGSKFSLCFRLKCSSLALGSLADMVVISNPIEVFSHSQYLGKSDGDDRAKTQPGAIKYADNPAGLHLKLMESIHAFKELGGAQETLINYITAIYNQNNPIPSAMVALPPSGLPQIHPQQLPEGFILQHQQPILPHTGERSTSPTGTIFSGTPPNVSPRSSFHSAALPPQPSFPLTPTPRRCSPTSSGSSSPPSSPPSLFTVPPTHAPVPMSVPPHPRASPALFPPGAPTTAPASVPLTPQTASSMLPGIASLLASSGVALPPLASSASPAPVPSSPSHTTSSRRPSVGTLLQQPVQEDHLRGGSSLLSSLLLAPLQALSEACRDKTNSSKRKAKESGEQHEHEQLRRAAEGDDLDEKEKRERRHKRRRKSAD